MSKEEILKYIQEEIENETDTFHWFDNTPNNKTRKDIEKSIQAHQGLLDLYNKEKAIVDLMAEQLTTPVHNKEWVINYFEEKVK